MESMLTLRQLRWAGHVARMDDSRIPKTVFYGELRDGKRNVGAPRRRYKDQLKQQLTRCDIDHRSWETLAANRSAWRTTTKKAVEGFEEVRTQTAKEKRRRRKEATAQTVDPCDQPMFLCAKCKRQCKSRIGLFSHMKACARLAPSHSSH